MLMGRAFSVLLATALPLLALGCGGSFSSESPGGDASTDAKPGVDASSDAKKPDGSPDGCSAKTCAAVGAECGKTGDTCGGTLECGSCPAPKTCGSDNKCACVPRTCGQLSWMCGTGPNGCGGTLDCGPCGEGLTCGGGGDHVCGTQPCTKTTCAAHPEVQCGSIPDNCSSTIDCGTCQSPAVCANNKCACEPAQCTACGTGLPNGCGGEMDCPCQGTHSCIGGVCKDCPNCSVLGYQCGTLDNGCGISLSCGACTGSKSCDPTTHQCADSVTLACTGCPMGYASAIVLQQSTACDGNCPPTNIPSVCVLTPFVVQAYASPGCLPGTHLAMTVPGCYNSTAYVCVSD